MVQGMCSWSGRFEESLGTLEDPYTCPCLPPALLFTPAPLWPLIVKAAILLFPGISRQEGLQKMSSSSCLRTIQR